MQSISPAPAAQTIRRKQLGQDLRAYLFLAPWIFSLLVFTAYPMLSSFYYSLTRYTILNPPVWIGLDNFVTMFTRDQLYWTAVWNTIYFTIFSVPLSLAVALGLALLLNQRAVGIGVYRTIYYLPALVPAVAGTLLFVVLLDPRNGLVNTVLGSLGLPEPGWLRSAAWSKPGLILLSIWAGTGGSMLIFLAGLKDVPASLLEAALIDGAGPWQRFRYVILPLLTPVLYFNLIIGIINSFQVFGPVFIATVVRGLGPLNSLLMYMQLIYRNAFNQFNMGYASAMALVLFVVLVALTLLLVRTSRYWVFYEGEKRA